MKDEWIFAELRRIRKEKGLTLVAVAGAIGVCKDSFRKYESGDVNPPFFRVVKWADFLGYQFDLHSIDGER